MTTPVHNTNGSGMDGPWRKLAAGLGSTPALLLLTILFLTLYVVQVPSFEGPDESEHCRFIEAYARGVNPLPVDSANLYRWGYELNQPPLYYWLMGQYAKVVRPTFPDKLIVNPRQNPMFPFLRHDGPGERFPFDAAARGLRLLRLPSLGLGIVTFFLLIAVFRLLLPEDPVGVRLLLATAMLMPNTLQSCATVTNDTLLLPVTAAAFYFGIRVMRASVPNPRDFLLAGIMLGIGFWVKMTVFIPLLALALIWGLDLLFNRRLRYYAAGLGYFLAPLLLLAGPYLLPSWLFYGGPTRESLMKLFTPIFYQEAARPFWVVLRAASLEVPPCFAADLCWQQIHVPVLSVVLFWTWLAAAAVAVWLFLSTRQQPPGPNLLLLVAPGCILAITVFLCLANRHWQALQVRHSWCVFPLTLTGLALIPARLWPGWYNRSRGWAYLLIVAGLVLMNLVLLRRLEFYYQPSLNLKNRDFQSYLYAHVNDRVQSVLYLNFGNFLVRDYQEALANGQWERALVLTRQAAAEGQLPNLSNCMQALALYSLERRAEAKVLLEPLKYGYPPAFPLYAQLLLESGDRPAALAYLKEIRASGRLPPGSKLESLFQEMEHER